MIRLMKDSGFKWIGEIPEQWDINKAKRIFKREKRPIINQEIVTAFRDGQVTQRRNRRTNGFTMAEKEHGYQGVETGDLVIHAMDAFAGAIGISDSPGKCSPVCSICTPIIKLDSHYYAYLLRTYARLGYIESLATGIRERSTDFRYSTFANSPLVCPTVCEQQKIANFLDQKVSQIDSILDNTKKSVEEFKKYKQALITETVTKGLNPDIKMKDSGIKWIGEMPEHFNLGRIKLFTTKIGSGKTPKGGANVYTDSGILFLRSQNIYNTGLYLDEATYISEEIDLEMKNTRVYPNDVLLNITGGSIGRCCIYPPTTIQHANVNQHVCIIRTIEDKITSKYLYYFLCSNAGESAINFYQTGANREGLNFEQIGNIKIPSLAIEEQNEIVAFLDGKCSHIDSIIEKKQQLIKEFEDYKKSLIYEYVTGKKEVL